VYLVNGDQTQGASDEAIKEGVQETGVGDKELERFKEVQRPQSAWPSVQDTICQAITMRHQQ
jgi:hypothetical protein